MMEIKQCPACSLGNQAFQYKSWQGDSFVKCLDCGLVFQNPRKVTDYEKYYSGVSSDPDGNERILVNERESKIKNLYRDDLNFVNRLKPGRILDAGCGCGFFLSGVNDQWEKYGTELSQYCVDYVKKEYPDIKVVQGYLEDCDFEDGFFDVVYFFHVIEHVFDPNKVMAELGRILRPGGVLIISTPNIGSFCAKRFKGNYRMLGSPHVILFSPQTLAALLKQHGFNVFKKCYPFFKTKYFNIKDILRMFNTKKISPPFYGNIMTFYAHKEG